MNQKKIFILLTFSLCLNVGLLGSIGWDSFSKGKGSHPLGIKNIDLLEGAGLSQETHAKALAVLDEMIAERKRVKLLKIENKLKGFTQLKKTPLMPEADLRTFFSEDIQFEKMIDESQFLRTMKLRTILSEAEMAAIYSNAEKELIRIRDHLQTMFKTN